MRDGLLDARWNTRRYEDALGRVLTFIYEPVPVHEQLVDVRDLPGLNFCFDEVLRSADLVIDVNVSRAIPDCLVLRKISPSKAVNRAELLDDCPAKAFLGRLFGGFLGLEVIA